MVVDVLSLVIPAPIRVIVVVIVCVLDDLISFSMHNLFAAQFSNGPSQLFNCEIIYNIASTRLDSLQRPQS